jgi:hypothetical protein
MGIEKAERTGDNHVPINVHSEYEIAYWVKKLGVTREELRSAIARVGPMADEIEDYFDPGRIGTPGHEST